MAIALFVGITVGVISASRPGTFLDVGGRLFGIITYALPLFWVRMLMQLIFVLTEVTFSWPGLANRLYEAISLRDYPTVQGILVFFAAIVVLASIVIDILNAYVDPRIRY